MIMAEPMAMQDSNPPRRDRWRRTGARARQGDLGAYDDLVHRYQERIYATVYHMTLQSRGRQRPGAGVVHQGVPGA